MKTIKIAHLYYDLLNLYGENGNIRFLKRVLNDQGLDVKISKFSIGDKIDFEAFDFYYIGCGSDESLLIALEDIKKYKDDIKKCIDDNKFFLATGNSIELFGTVIFGEDYDNPGALIPYEGLGIFDYHSPIEKERIVGEQYYETNLIPEKIVGFQNRSHSLEGCNDNLFNVISGCGYSSTNSSHEGVHKNNFYGTYLFGPLLVRNPYFTDYLVQELCKQNKIKYKKPDYENIWYRAYHEYLKNFYSNEKSTD